MFTQERASVAIFSCVIFAMATKVLLCRLCWKSTSNKKLTNLFSEKSLQQRWVSRITTLLDVPVHKDDNLPPHVCSKCLTRVVALERASIDLADFKRSAKSSLNMDTGVP